MTHVLIWVVPSFKTPRLGHSQATHSRLHRSRAWLFMSLPLHGVSLGRSICVPRPSNWKCSRTFHGRITTKLRTSTLRKLTHAGETTLEPHHNPPLPTVPSVPPMTDTHYWAYIARRATILHAALQPRERASSVASALLEQALLSVLASSGPPRFHV